MMTAEQVERAVRVAAVKRIERPLRVLYSGMLEPRKRVDALIDAVRLLVAEGVPIELTIVGHGPEGEALRARAGDLPGTGNRRPSSARCRTTNPSAGSNGRMRWSCPLRHSEGWPKVVAEGMCHGLLCVAVAHGQVPRMLTGRGVLLPTGSPEEIAQALRGAANDPAGQQPVMHAASAWARQFSLEGLRRALADLLADRWNLPSAAAAAADVPSSPPVREAR